MDRDIAQRRRRALDRLKLVAFAMIMPLAGCHYQADAPSPGNGSVEPPAARSEGPNDPRTSSVASLEGAWRVAGIDGQPLDEPFGLALTGDADKLWWEPRCAGMARSYRIDANTISFGSLEPRRAPGSPTPPVCAIGLPPRLSEVFRALDAARTIERTPENGIRIAGGGPSLLLFSQ